MMENNYNVNLTEREIMFLIDRLEIVQEEGEEIWSDGMIDIVNNLKSKLVQEWKKMK